MRWFGHKARGESGLLSMVRVLPSADLMMPYMRCCPGRLTSSTRLCLQVGAEPLLSVWGRLH